MGSTTAARRVVAGLAGLACGIALLGTWPVSAADDDWPSRHGGQTNPNASPDSAITTATVEHLRASWATVVEPNFRYEPIVAAGQAFVSCLADDPHPYRHCALGAEDGSLRWQVPAYVGTAASDGSTVFVTAAHHPAEFQALDAATGEVRWRVELDGSQIHMGPQLAGDLVLVTTMGPVLHALDAATGSVRWTLDVTERGVTPAVVGDDVYVPVVGGLAVVDRRTGSIRWVAQGARVTGSPLVHRGLVIVGSRSEFTAAYDADGCGTEACDPVWRSPHPTLYSPAAYDDLVFVVVERELVALDLATGAERWRTGRQTVMAAPVAVSGDLVFATSGVGTLVAYPATGCGERVCEPVWSARIDEIARPSSGPIVAGDAVYVTGSGALLRFSLPGDGPSVCPPGPPRNVRSRHDTVGTVVEWERPHDDGGAPVAMWHVTAPDGTEQLVRGAETQTSFDDTLSGAFTVRGENAAGLGPDQDASPAPCDRTGGPTATAPRGVRLHAGDGALLATWLPPVSDGGKRIDSYTVTLESDDGRRRTLQTRGERTWLHIGDLDGGVRYRATVSVDGSDSPASSWAQPAAGASLPDPAPGMARLSGADRIATAVAISAERFGDGEAAAAVLARADDFPDALTGTPLAAAVGGPLLLSHTGRLPAAVADELHRVLPPGGQVHLLGGPAALSDAVEHAISEAGFRTLRIAGRDRYETAVEVARDLGDPELALLAVGTDFPDALAAGAAAAHHSGMVLLTAGDEAHPATAGYLAQRDGSRVAVGGAAARAHPDAERVVGRTREETAVAVADRFFPGAQVAGLARRDDFADALVGAGHSAGLKGPIMLTPSGGLHAAPAAHRCGEPILQLWLYGGRAALDHAVTLDATTGC